LEKGTNLKDSDWVRVHSDKRGLDFHFITQGKFDGFSFKVQPGTEQINFKLLLNEDNDPQRVMIGAKGAKPKKIPFDLPAHPKEQ
jgi:hypothetical protein